MGIRRRRKKVNTILTTIDRRLRSVELQRVPRVVKDGTITKKMLDKEVQISLDSGADASTNTPGITAPQAPTFRTKPFTNIVKIVYRGYNEVGTDRDRDRARVYFETDPGLNVGDKIKFAAVTGSLDVPTKTTEYTVQEVGVVDGYHTIVYFPGRATIVDGAKTYDKGWRIQASNVSVTGAIVEGSTTKYKYGQIIVYSKDTDPSTNSDFLYGPTWPAGIETTSGVHFTGGGFALGSLINIEGLGTLFDGTHKVTLFEKVGTKLTIQFEFKDYPTAPVQLPNSNGAIRGAAGRYLRDGETWTDTSVDPPVTWIWDDQRQLWWNAATAELPEGVIVDDGVPPSAPTNLSGSSAGYVVGNKPFSRVSLSWTAPTTNSDGTNLSDLKGYLVYYRYTTSDSWTFYSDVASTSETVSELTPEKTVYFSVKAYDVTRNTSAFSSSYNINTVPGTTGINAPSTPVWTSRLGQLRVTWNGLDSSAATPPMDLLSHVEVHWSTTSNFTPSDSTNKGRLVTKNDFYSDIDPQYGTNYYFKFVFVDIFGKKSAASAQATATVARLVDADLIQNSLTRWPFGENTINVSSLSDGSIAATYLVSGSDSDGSAVRVQGKIAAGSIGAVSIAANSIVAGKIAADAITAREIEALTITADEIAGNTITGNKIATGTLTADKIDATTRIRLGDSNTTNPTNYVEFGYITLPGAPAPAPAAPGILGQYNGKPNFYLGGWNSGQQTSGMSLGVMYRDDDNNVSRFDVLEVTGYDNGAPNIYTSLGAHMALDLYTTGGSVGDFSGSGITISTEYSAGPIRLYSSGGQDSQGIYAGVVVNNGFLVGKTNLNGAGSPSGFGWQGDEGTQISSGFIATANSSGPALGLSRRQDNGTIAAFYRGNQTIVGSINVTTTATTYVTSSDYRLKENITDLVDPVTKLLGLRPRTFNFKLDPENSVDGFIAHELQEVVPGAVAGLKDEVDEEGAPVYQGVDASVLVPILTASLQIALSRIDDLSTRIDLLENQ